MQQILRKMKMNVLDLDKTKVSDRSRRNELSCWYMWFLITKLLAWGGVRSHIYFCKICILSHFRFLANWYGMVYETFIFTCWLWLMLFVGSLI